MSRYLPPLSCQYSQNHLLQNGVFVSKNKPPPKKPQCTAHNFTQAQKLINICTYNILKTQRFYSNTRFKKNQVSNHFDDKDFVN